MAKKYKVMAVMTSHCYLEVEADNKDQAFDIANKTDGGDFFSDDGWGGDWWISSVEEIKEGK